MTTVGISLSREITEKVRPPRTLYVPFPFGYPLGAPRDPAMQSAIVTAALALVEEEGPPPVARSWQAPCDPDRINE